MAKDYGLIDEIILPAEKKPYIAAASPNGHSLIPKP
jgi:hypothetical protein